jgi:hypothetical protein
MTSPSSAAVWRSTRTSCIAPVLLSGPELGWNSNVLPSWSTVIGPNLPTARVVPSLLQEKLGPFLSCFLLKWHGFLQAVWLTRSLHSKLAQMRLGGSTGVAVKVLTALSAARMKQQQQNDERL